MVSNVLANLDRSRAVIPEGELNQFILHRDGTVSAADTSLRGLYYRFIQVITDCLFNSTLLVITTLFNISIDALKKTLNDRTNRLRDVSLAELLADSQRVEFICKIILAHQQQLMQSPTYRTCVTDALSTLLPNQTISFPTTVEIASDNVLKQIDPRLAYRLEELIPPPLSKDLLERPSDEKWVTQLPPIQESLSDLGEIYQALAIKTEKRANWFFMTAISFWPWSFLAITKRNLGILGYKIQNGKSHGALATAKVYLQYCKRYCKDETIPPNKRKAALEELAAAAPWCDPRILTTAEMQFRSLSQKAVTIQDQFLIWKTTFIEQTLLEGFLPTYLVNEFEASHNTHYLNAIYHEWGAKLGILPLESTKQDTYRIRRLPFSWEDIYRYLIRAWNTKITQSLIAQVQADHYESQIREFLIHAMRDNVENPTAFVTEEYFTEMGVLNELGANRFLREILTSLPIVE